MQKPFANVECGAGVDICVERGGERKKKGGGAMKLLELLSSVETKKWWIAKLEGVFISLPASNEYC